MDLNALMEFDHVIRVNEDESITEMDMFPAPSVYVDGTMVTVDDSRWTLVDGFSGQEGYSGPLMHASEYVGGHLEDYIRSTPGIYVVVAVYDLEIDECTEWAIATLNEEE